MSKCFPLLTLRENVLLSVSRADPAKPAVTGTLVLVMSLVASAVPAFRGAGVDPSVTLRAD